MDVLIGALTVTFLLVIGFKAYGCYSTYSNSVLRYVFGSYLEYFWNMIFREDLSRSAYLTSEIGYHRLAFNAYCGSDGRQVTQFTTVLSTRGVDCLVECHGSGEMEGGENGVWCRTKGGCRAILPSRMPALKQQATFLRKALGASDIRFVLVFDDDAQLEGVECGYPCIHAKDVVAYLREGGETISEREVEEAFGAFKSAAHGI